MKRKPKKSKRGFAAMSLAKRRAIAQLGGRAISRNKKHMAKLGRKGGKSTWRRHLEKV